MGIVLGMGPLAAAIALAVLPAPAGPDPGAGDRDAGRLAATPAATVEATPVRVALHRAVATATRGPGALVGMDTAADGAGGRLTRLQQNVDGLPVLGGQVIVGTGPDGQAREVVARVTDPSGVDPARSVHPARATALARTAAATATTAIPAGRLRSGTPELAVLDPALFRDVITDDVPHLVWRVTVTGPGPLVDEVWVDARDGGIELRQDRAPDARERRVCDAGDSPAAVPCLEPVRAEGDPATGIDEVDAAYDHAGTTYQYLHDVLGLDSYDGAGAPMLVTVRYCSGGCPYRNASWQGEQVVAGHGYALADDVVAHEFAHGLTQATADLVYAGQSGAISESVSDIVGELVDQSTPDAGRRWEVGEDTGSAFRDMADPTRFGDPDRITSTLWATGSADASGVHTNSGVGNRFAALLVDGGTFNGVAVDGIGPERTLRLVYAALQRLTSGATYADLSAAVRASCSALTGTAGIDSGTCGSADAALRAVEMDTPPAVSSGCASGDCIAPLAAPAAPAVSSVEWDAAGGLVVSFAPGTDGGSPVTNVEYSLDSGSTWSARDPAGVTSPLRIPGVTAGRSYWVTLRMVNAVGPGTRSDPLTITVPAASGSPPAPAGPPADRAVRARVRDAVVRDGRLRVRWRLTATPASVAGVIVQVARRAEHRWGSWVTVRAGLAAAPSAVAWKLARPGAAYRVRVRAVAGDGIPGPWSRGVVARRAP